MSTELEVFREKVVAKVEAMDKRALGASLLIGQTSMAAQIRMAQAVADLLEMVKDPEVIAPIMALQGTNLGIIVDRQYRADELAMPVVEARLRGFNLTGAEFAVIKGKFYAAKAGLRRRLTDGVTFPTLTDFRDSYGVPAFTPDGRAATIEAKATWKYQKKADEFATTFLIRVNEGMGPDAVIGKAERKLCKRVHDILSGMNTPDPDDEVFTGNNSPFQSPTPPSTSDGTRASSGRAQRVVDIPSVPENPPQDPPAAAPVSAPHTPPPASAETARPTAAAGPKPEPTGGAQAGAPHPLLPMEHIENWMSESGVPWDWIQQKMADLEVIPNIQTRALEDLDDQECRRIFQNRTAILRTWKAKNAPGKA